RLDNIVIVGIKRRGAEIAELIKKKLLTSQTLSYPQLIWISPFTVMI
ncbi:hypothetical protein AAUPMC_12686, partial [Pasteurella multocida subsp. multocida str. Anand1_cattle]